MKAKATSEYLQRCNVRLWVACVLYSELRARWSRFVWQVRRPANEVQWQCVSAGEGTTTARSPFDFR